MISKDKRQEADDLRTVTVTSKFSRRLRREVEQVAAEREWSLSKAIQHLTERGLEQVSQQRSSQSA
jgi:hypothetical protein